MTKICTKCKKEKTLDEFSPQKGRKYGTHCQCRLCISTAMKISYHKNPLIKKENIKRCWEKVTNIVNEIKRKTGCKFCPEKEVVCLDFHHLDPNEKNENVSKFVKSKSLKMALEEIKKCICVCSNCHRKIHAGILNIGSDP